MSAERKTNVDVLIQGAGIGGLTLAISLFQKGYSVRVVERAGSLSEIGAGIWMATNPMQIFDRLGFAEKVTNAGWTIHRLTLADYSGETLQLSDLSAVSKLFGFETVALHRAALQRVLYEQLPEDTVCFGMEVKSLHEGMDTVSVQLTDDSSVEVKLVVGADGFHSQIRQMASLGGSVRYSGSSSYRAIARGAKLFLPQLDHDAYEIWGKECRVGFSKINADDCYWYMTFESQQDKIVSPSARQAHAASLFRQFFPQWMSLLDNTLPDDILQTDISDLRRLPKWSSGCIGLIGDAAHATTPNLGQGGAMAVEDAYSLAGAIVKAGLNRKAFEQYEQQRREKVDWTVSTSWKIGRICHWKNPILRALRNAALKQATSRGGEKQMKKLYSVSGV